MGWEKERAWCQPWKSTGICGKSTNLCFKKDNVEDRNLRSSKFRLPQSLSLSQVPFVRRNSTSPPPDKFALFPLYPYKRLCLHWDWEDGLLSTEESPPTSQNAHTEIIPFAFMKAPILWVCLSLWQAAKPGFRSNTTYWRDYNILKI